MYINRLFRLISLAIACLYSVIGHTQISYVTGRLDSFTWSQTRTGINIHAHMSYTSSLGSRPACYDKKAADSNKIVAASSCGLNISYHVKGSPQVKYVPFMDGGASMTVAERAKTIENIGFISRSQLKIPDNAILESVCLTEYYSDSVSSVYNAPISGICSADPIIPPDPAPDSCNISLNNSTIDFGEIADTDFSEAGAGNKPESIRPQERIINVSCTNNSPESTNANILFESESVSGDIIVSTNKDVGFTINDGNGKTLSPNDFSKMKKIVLDETRMTTFSVTVQPVSVTGKTPETGAFSATAVMDVIFD